MMQNKKRELLIEALLREYPRQNRTDIPEDEERQKRLLRSLMNVRPPRPVDGQILAMQDEYLREELSEKGITDLKDLTPVEGELYVWKGDITTLACDGIVNAANGQMLGCFCPCHGCIDNAIHTYAGMQLRQECARIMAEQGHDERVGGAKITGAYNLPCKYVIHTVGPYIADEPTEKDCALLSSCYTSCLKLAHQNGLQSLAFCCISTGEFHFPNELAAQIAVETVKNYKRLTGDSIKVIFNVFKERDYEIYRRIFNARAEAE